MTRLCLWIIGLLLLIPPVRADAPLTIVMPTSIVAGEPLSIIITQPTAQAGDKLTITLLHGFSRHDAQLTIGTGGITNWHIPADELIHAGEALLLVGDVRQSLTILPNTPAQTDLITTANSLTAYGEGKAMLITLVRDAFGNPIIGRASLNVLFPNFTRLTMSLPIRDGLGWTYFSSVGGVGRTRIRLSAGVGESALEIRQNPSHPALIELDIVPECLFADGRDPLQLVASVYDGYHHPVADGTQVIFRWLGGEGSALTLDGTARLSIPAPTRTGVHYYSAMSGEAQSNTTPLIIAERCAP